MTGLTPASESLYLAKENLFLLLRWPRSQPPGPVPARHGLHRRGAQGQAPGGAAHVTTQTGRRRPAGRYAPRAAAVVGHRPLGRAGIRLTGGLLHDWQQRNRAASLPLALRQLEAAGNLDNLRLAIAGGDARATGARCSWTPTCTRRWRRSAGSSARGPSSRSCRDSPPRRPALLEKAQQPDGYLNSYVQVTGKPRYTHLPPATSCTAPGHLIQAAVAPAQTRGAGARPPLFGVAPAVRRPPGRRVPGHAGRPRRPPDRGDRPGRAVPGDRPRGVPAAGRASSSSSAATG